MKNKSEKISTEYSKAIKENKNIVSATGQAKFADYPKEELKNLPKGVEEHSFGCGNPLAFSDVQAGQTILDLGCGAGLDLLLAVERVGSNGKVIGVDINEDMLTLARERTSTFSNIEILKGSIENLPIEANSVDLVISNCVINLSQDKQQAFNEISRVLKPKGRMSVSDIVAEQLPWWVKNSGVLHAACGGGVISEKKYLEGLSLAGMHDCKVVARQHYETSQLASIVMGAAPAFISKINCCGKSIFVSAK